MGHYTSLLCVLPFIYICDSTRIGKGNTLRLPHAAPLLIRSCSAKPEFTSHFAGFWAAKNENKKRKEKKRKEKKRKGLERNTAWLYNEYIIYSKITCYSTFLSPCQVLKFEREEEKHQRGCKLNLSIFKIFCQIDNPSCILDAGALKRRKERGSSRNSRCGCTILFPIIKIACKMYISVRVLDASAPRRRMKKIKMI